MPTPPRATVHAEQDEYLIEVDVADVDVAHLTASAVHGVLEIHVPRLPSSGQELHFLHPQAEPV